MNIVYSSKDNDKCTTNSNYGYTHNNSTGKRKKYNFHSKFNVNLKNSFLLLFTFFSIVLPVGVQPLLQTTEAFDQSVINDNINGMREDSNDNGNGNDKANKNAGAFADPASIDLTSSTASSHIGTQSTDGNNKIVPNDESKEELSFHAGTQSSYKTYRDYVDSNTNENANENVIVTEDQSTTESSSTAAASSQSQLSAQSANEVYGDFNGDGRDDLAIGVARENVDTAKGTRSNAGAVNVLYGSSSGLSATSPLPDQFWTQNTEGVNDVAEEGDLFGFSLSAGDFNGDGRDDLAIGVPFEGVDTGAGTIFGAGAVNVLYGSSSGLSATSRLPDQFWTQSTPDVNDNAEDSNQFGLSLASADFNGDGRDDLAIGVPFEGVDTGAGTITNAGAVNVLYGSSNGLSATSPLPDQIWTQSTKNVNDDAEVADLFGDALG